MSKVVTEKQINNFVKGLITEANPLTYPPNSSIDEENFELLINGSRRRRLGLDYESGYALRATGIPSPDAAIQASKVSFHYWPNPGGSTTVSLGVIRIEHRIFFIDLLNNTPSGVSAIKNSGNYISLSIDNNFDCAVVNGYLVIASGITNTYNNILSYNPATDTVTLVVNKIKIRDFYGVYENVANEERPVALTVAHNYNLLNQGWNSDRMISTCGVAVSPIQCVKNTVNPVTPGGVAIPTGYPSNADIMSLGKIGATGAAGIYNKFDPLALFANSTDNNQAPKGHFVIEFNDRGAQRGTLSGLAGLPADQDDCSPSCVASYASRAFFSGLTPNLIGGDSNSPNLGSYILFSQVASNLMNLSKCYQENDPTSPDISDILDTDGGTIHIPEASKIVKMIPYGSSLLVFAENGIWEITGENGVFKATSYQVNKITNIGTVSPQAIVEGGGTLMYWANSGIYAVIPDATTGRLSVENITLSTIQSKYNLLSATCKQYAKGMYDERNNCIRWLYNDTATYSTTNYINKYNKQLNLNLSLKAFSIYNIGDTSATTSPYVADFIKIPNYSPSSTVSRTEPYSLLTIKNGTFTISKYSNLNFKDWYTNDSVGVDYSSYLVTGYEYNNDIMHLKQIPYVIFYMTRTEDGYSASGTDLILNHQSSCLVQSQWNWTNSANSGKWGTEFQAYRLLRNYTPSGVADTFDYGESIIMTKNKLRGSGKVISFKMRSETGKDLQLLGWAMVVTANSEV